MTLLLTGTALTLTACVTREQADEKLARGCAAGADMFMTDGYKTKSIKQSTFADSADLGPGYRVANVTLVVSDGWAEVDKDISCIFSESHGFMGASYNAQIYQLKLDEQIIGKEGNEIVGGYDANLKLTEGVDKALMQ